MILGIAVVTALLAGFLAGFVCFKKTNEYCGRCGVTRVCPICPDQNPDPAEVRLDTGHNRIGREPGVSPALA